MNQRPDYINQKREPSSAEVLVAKHHAPKTNETSSSQVSASGEKVLRNTYMLLSMTLLFSAFTAMLSMKFNLPYPGMIITLVVYFGLLFAVHKLKDSSMGIVAVFALTGFLGATLGPMLNLVAALPGGSATIGTALMATGGIFLAMATWVTTTGKDLSGWGKMLMAGILIGFVLSIGAAVFGLPVLALAVSAMFVILMTGLIAYEISNILHGGETNYILATVTLYVALFNLFVSLLHLLSAFSGED